MKRVQTRLQRSALLWETDVGGFLVSHSCYSNKVHLRLHDKMIIVRGEEGAGSYVSIVQLSSGQLLTQRVVPRWK